MKWQIRASTGSKGLSHWKQADPRNDQIPVNVTFLERTPTTQYFALWMLSRFIEGRLAETFDKGAIVTQLSPALHRMNTSGVHKVNGSSERLENPRGGSSRAEERVT